MGNTINTINKEKVHLKSYSVKTCNKTTFHFSPDHHKHIKKANSDQSNMVTAKTTNKPLPKKQTTFLICDDQQGVSDISSNASSSQQTKEHLNKNQNDSNNFLNVSPNISCDNQQKCHSNKSSKRRAQRRRSAVELLQTLWKQRQRKETTNRSVSSCSLLQVESLATTVQPELVVALEASLKEPKTFNSLLRWGLLKVSVDTMAITALPLDCWLKERLKNWVQLSGHQGTIVPASNHSLWKKQPQGSHIESKAYSQIMLDPALRGITPNFIREIQHRNEVFIEIQDLLAEFPDPSTRAIMDIKIGTRTFLESEVANRHKRCDLYRKMIELSPDEPTEEERQDEAITKLRYMQFRERKSSSATLGFRIEAAQLPNVPIQKNFKQVKTRLQVSKALRHFCGSEKICKQFAQRLRHIRDSVEASIFFSTHEVVGSSILLIHNGGCNNNNNENKEDIKKNCEIKIGAWLIDFAKCHRIEGGGKLTHRKPWDLGNHEDGYLTGLDNLVELLDENDQGEVEENDENLIKEKLKLFNGDKENIDFIDKR